MAKQNENSFAFTNQSFYDKFLIEHLHIPMTESLRKNDYKELWKKVYSYYWNTAFEFPIFREEIRIKLYEAHDLLHNPKPVNKRQEQEFYKREMEGRLLLEDVWFSLSSEVARTGQYKTRSRNKAINPLNDDDGEIDTPEEIDFTDEE